ncbi:MAG TPA: MG2 domain-containing protein, partial [Vicinamibacterales bacterium]
MTFRRLLLTLAVGLLFVCPAGAQTPSAAASLRIVKAGPTGEVATIEEANEVRIVFSEPMVNLGQVTQARPAFFRLAPNVAGTYRWSGTTLLIFTPARRFPLATTFDVTIEAGAAAVSGRKLAAAYSFSFTTPTARLMRTQHYRPGNRFDAQPIVVLHFNQPVRPEDVLPHLAAAFAPHQFAAPNIPQAVQTRLASTDAAAIQAFTRKVQAARAAASSSAAVSLAIARDWDKKHFPPSADMVVVQVTTNVPPESWVRINVDGKIPSLAGPATSGRTQSYTVQLEPAFFVDQIACTGACDPDRHNPIQFTVPVKADAFAKALNARDVTDSANERAMRKGQPRARGSWEQDVSSGLTVEDAGFAAQPPASTWLVSLPADFTAADGQTLGYSWAGLVENWHQRAFTSFGDGHGVWETGGGSQLPFYARNVTNVKQWASAVEPPQLMSTLLTLQSSQFRTAPDSAPVERRLGGTPDRILSHGLDLSRGLKPTGSGLIWAAVEEGTPIAKSRAAVTRDGGPMTRASLIQVTNLGITVKDSPQNTLIFVTRLDSGAPVAGAKVSIIKVDGEAQWTGTTAADGVAIAPETRLRNPRRWFEFSFLVMAEKDGDVAYVGSDWNEGIIPWEFGVPLNLNEADPLLCGSVFTDRGVYRLAEEVHLKAILRSNTPGGIKLLGEGTEVHIRVRDSRNKVVDERVVKVNAWSTAEWTMTVPAEGSLGNYSIRAVLASEKATADRAEEPTREEEADWYDRSYAVTGSFLVAAYRRPDFRVDVTLTGDSRIAGDPLKGVVNGRYLFGAPLNKRPVHWTFTRTPVYQAPGTITDKFSEDRWTFVGWIDDAARTVNGQMAANDGVLTPDGQLALTLDTDAKAGVPYAYALEGDVEDVSRQHIANRAVLTVHPAPWYIGVKRFPLFVAQKDGLGTELVAVGLDGKPVAGLGIDVKLTQVQWTSV